MLPQTPDIHLAASSPLPSYGITIIYEDRETGLRAKRFSDLLTASLGSETSGEPSLWRLELIDLPSVAEQLSQAAAGSDFLVLSLRGDTSLSITARRWFDSWLEVTNPETAHLVVLFDPASSIAAITDSMRCYLRQIASEAGIAFFAHYATTPGKGADRKGKEEERGTAMKRKLRRGYTHSVKSTFSTTVTASLLPAVMPI